MNREQYSSVRIVFFAHDKVAISCSSNDSVDGEIIFYIMKGERVITILSQGCDRHDVRVAWTMDVWFWGCGDVVLGRDFSCGRVFSLSFVSKCYGYFKRE